MDDVLNMLTGNNGGTEQITVDEKAKNIVDDEEESDEFDDKMDRELDKEEKEMDDGDSDDEDEDSEKLLQDLSILEEAMEEELERVAKKVKPVRQALYKVSPSFLFFFFLFFSPIRSLPFFYIFNSDLFVAFVLLLIRFLSSSYPIPFFFLVSDPFLTFSSFLF